MKTYQDFCSTITKQLFSIIDQKGGLLNWRKNWDSQGCPQLPTGSNGLYRGANLWALLNAQWELGYGSNQWLTFNQVKRLKGAVKKGAKSHPVFFWQINEIEKLVEGKKIVEQCPCFRVYAVFNLEQTSLAAAPSVGPAFQAQAIEALLGQLAATVSHFGNKACYDPGNDVIVLPAPQRFESRENYYTALLHELVHWTGKAGRVPRQCFDDYRKNIVARAEEELIAEIGSVLLAAHYGLKGELENHASYVQSWKSELNAKQVMAAVNKATKIFAWLLGRHSAS